MVAGNTAQVPKEIVEALEALERLVVRYGTIPRDRAEVAAAYLTKEHEGIALELEKKAEDLAPAPEVVRSPRPARPMRSGGPRRGPRRDEAPTESAPAEAAAATDAPAEAASGEEAAAPAEPAPTEKPAETP